MAASASGMIVAAKMHPAEQVRRPRGHQNDDEQPRRDVADALDAQVGAGGLVAEIWLHAVAGGGDTRRDDEPCADEDDCRGDQSGRACSRWSWGSCRALLGCVSESVRMMSGQAAPTERRRSRRRSKPAMSAANSGLAHDVAA